eukprot:scaffold3997_cov106-Skeletonema_dohrnii-CCMP3373.AAC.1
MGLVAVLWVSYMIICRRYRCIGCEHHVCVSIRRAVDRRPKAGWTKHSSSLTFTIISPTNYHCYTMTSAVATSPDLPLAAPPRILLVYQTHVVPT